MKKMKVVVTVVGRDQVGIIAKVSTILADHQVNIVDVNQNIVDGFFNMALIADMRLSTINLKELQTLLQALGQTMGLQIKAQHEDIFRSMHQI